MTTPEPTLTDEGKKCVCSMRIQLVGDGCSVCNPEFWAELLSENDCHAQPTNAVTQRGG
jgi:hypothetical protein